MKSGKLEAARPVFPSRFCGKKLAQGATLRFALGYILGYVVGILSRGSRASLLLLSLVYSIQPTFSDLIPAGIAFLLYLSFRVGPALWSLLTSLGGSSSLWLTALVALGGGAILGLTFHPWGSGFLWAGTFSVLYIARYYRGFGQSESSALFAGDPDAPISNPSEDRLIRAPIAYRAFKTIEGSPPEQTRVIAVYGDWGSGKTSLMHMIRHYCFQAGYATVWYNPWQYGDEREALRGFALEVSRVLDGKPGTVPWRRLTERVYELLGRGLPADPTARLILSLVLGFPETPEHRSLSETKRRLNVQLEQVLGPEGRLVVFVDDLDRCHPHLAARLFMLLSEVMDLRHCSYVLALDKKSVHGLLKDIEPTERVRYLEKIVDTFFEVPDPSSIQFRDFVGAQIEAYRSSGGSEVIHEDQLDVILDVLPRNPRRIKRFLRRLVADAPLLSRFSKEEIRWDLLYIARLVVEEFPDVYHDLIADSRIRGVLENPPSSGVSEEQRSKLLDALQSHLRDHNETHLHRAYQLLAAFAGRVYEDGGTLGLSCSKPEDYFLLAESPELMTRKEFQQVFERWKPEGRTAREVVEEFAGTYPRPIIQCRQAVRLALAVRNDLIESVYEEPLEERQVDYVEEALKVGEFIGGMSQVVYPESGDKYVMDVALFQQILAHASSHAHFQGSLYKPLRDQERSVLLKAANIIDDCDKSKYLDLLEPWDMSGEKPVLEHRRAFEPVRQELISKLVMPILRSLPEWLLRPGAVHYLCYKAGYQSVRWLLLDGNGPLFHDGKYLELISALRSNAAGKAVRMNCHAYLLLLLQAATSGFNPVSRDGARQVINGHPEFVQQLWAIATAVRLNRRYWETLKRYRDNLRPILARPDLFPDPSWAAEIR